MLITTLAMKASASSGTSARHVARDCSLYRVRLHKYRIFYAGSLDHPDSFEPAFAIHVSSKAAWETIPVDLETFDGDAPG